MEESEITACSIQFVKSPPKKEVQRFLLESWMCIRIHQGYGCCFVAAAAAIKVKR